MIKHYKNLSLVPIEGEQWVDIKGYEGLYKISNKGRIFALNPSFYFPNGGFCKRESLIKRQFADKDGYMKTCLTKDKKQKTFSVHRLVATHFIPNINNYPCIDHINGIRDDNRVENLRWCTFKQNVNFELAKINRSESIKNSYLNNPSRKDRIIEYNEKRKIPIIQYDLNGNFINKFSSLSDAEKSTGIKCFSLRGNVFYKCGFIWSTHEIEDISIFPYHPKTRPIKVVKTDINSGEIIMYRSLTEAAISENKSVDFIKNICKKEGIFNGYKFQYK